MITFNMGIPCGGVPIVVEGYGLATFHLMAGEDGDIQIYIGGGRIMTVPGKTRWRYAK